MEQQMEQQVVQNNQTEVLPLTYNLNLDNVLFNEKFRVNSGSLGQLMKGLKIMSDKIIVDNETDNYKKVLYPKLKFLSESLVAMFNEMLLSTSEAEKNVKFFNLLCPNGQIRPNRFRKYPFVAGINPRLRYNYANFGCYVKLIKQRLTHLSYKNLPYRYQNDEDSKKTFEDVKLKCKNMLDFIEQTVNPEWNLVVQKARESGGEIVQKNLQSRFEAKEKRRLEFENKKKNKFGKVHPVQNRQPKVEPQNRQPQNKQPKVEQQNRQPKVEQQNKQPKVVPQNRQPQREQFVNDGEKTFRRGSGSFRGRGSYVKKYVKVE